MNQSTLYFLIIAALLVFAALVFVGPRELVRHAGAQFTDWFFRTHALGVVMQTKTVIAIAPISKTAAATATGVIDRLGFNNLTLDVLMTTADAVSNKPSVLKIAESDITDSTGYADVTALVGGGTGGFTIPNALTSGDWVAKFNLDLRARKRYLKLSVSPLTTQTITAIANLAQAEQAPNTATKAGAAVLVEA